MAAAELLAHPALPLLAGAVGTALLAGRSRDVVALASAVAAIALVLAADERAGATFAYAGLALEPLRVDATSRIFALALAIAAFAGVLFGFGQRRPLELPCALAYAGAALVVVFAGDLVTLFVGWELMAIASTLVIWSAATPRAYGASMRYLFVHLLGGTLLLLGIGARYVATGDIGFRAMSAQHVGDALILAAFLVNAAAPPLWSWVADAYPEATPTGTVFLAAFTTKVAVYALLRGFPGADALVPLGLAMAAYGLVFAAREHDMRRLLAYGIVNQVGVMLVGIGIGTEMARNGVAAQAFTHIAYKSLLLMAAGAVIQATGRRSLAEVGGLARTMPLTSALAAVGVLTMGAPGTLGFVAKAMIAQAAADEHRIGLWLALAAISAAVFAVVGLRFAWFAFFGRNAGLQPADPPLPARLAMGAMALLCVGLGVFHEPLYRMLPQPTDFAPYTASHVVAQLQLLLGATAAFVLLRRFLTPRRTVTVDVDWLYRRALPVVAVAVEQAWRASSAASHAMWQGVLARLASHVHRMHGPQGILARTWSVRSMGLWMLALLLGLLVIGFVS